MRPLCAATLLCHLLLHWTAATCAGDEPALRAELRRLESRLRRRYAELREELAARSDDTDSDDAADGDGEPTDEWTVRVLGGDEAAAARVAHKFGMVAVRKVRNTDDLFIMRRKEIARRADDGGDPEESCADIGRHESVVWARRERAQARTKRSDGQLLLARQVIKKDGSEEAHRPAVDKMFNDPLWPKQWYLHDTRTNTSLPKLDLHVLAAWRRGLNGTGVVVTILDDGVQANHSDIAQNYKDFASYDLNDDDPDPTPRPDMENKHGTRCAGEVSMVADNGICGVGVAPAAGIGGIRMLDGKVTDRLEYEALTHNLDKVHIFSASWGPLDNGKTVNGPGEFTAKAIAEGINNGRGGLGTVYVWASGNGGREGDDCNCDGYTESPYTFSVSSAGQDGAFPLYGERCPSTLTTTYSSGAYRDQMISTIDTVNGCTSSHSGTSAAAPLAAGILALALHANPALTWRDLQHLAVWSSEPAPLMKEAGWHANANGLWVSDKFGFGLMNADAMTQHAANWTSVPALHVCTAEFDDFERGEIFVGKEAKFTLETDACAGQKQEVKYLESLQVVVDVQHRRRGDLAVWIESPSGTRTKLLRPRKLDNSADGFDRWPLMSVHTWSEHPAGKWTLTVLDKTGKHTESATGALTGVSLVFYGTKDMPEHYTSQREYNMNYNDVRDEFLEYERAVERSHALAERALYADDPLAVGGVHGRRKRTTESDAGRIQRDLDTVQDAIDALEEVHDHEFRYRSDGD